MLECDSVLMVDDLSSCQSSLSELVLEMTGRVSWTVVSTGLLVAQITYLVVGL